MSTTSANGKFGDFKDGANGGNDDYVYDANGNVVIDLNKNAKDLNNIAGANGIHYNFLDKPDQIRIAGKGTIQIVYSAEGEKLKRIFTPEGTGVVTATTYIGQFVYQSSNRSDDALSYINFEEGRIRVVTATSQNNGYDALSIDGNMNLPNSKRGAYDYYVMDYQQNVRMILTEETHVASSTCTMEIPRAGNEDPVFGQTGGGNEVETTRFAKPSGWNTNPSASVSRLGNNAGKNIGPNVLQKVMAGDNVTATVQYYYQTSTGNDNPNFLSAVLSSLAQGLTGNSTTNIIKDNVTGITNQLNVNTEFVNAITPAGSGGTTPQAYLTILFFDERFNFISAADGGAVQTQVVSVGSSGASLSPQTVKAPKNGYVYIYVNNRSDEDVYFDNLNVAIASGNIIEENHYYAYGLKISAISSKKLGDSYEGNLDNKYQMQGAFSEMDDDIGWNDFALRNYDPQIARWVQQDPYQQFASPYVGMGDDPVNNADPSGGSIPGFTAGESIVMGAVVGAITGATIGAITSGDGLKGALTGAVLGAGAGINLNVTTKVVQVASIAITIVNTKTISKQAGKVVSGLNTNSQPEPVGHGPIGPLDFGEGDGDPQQTKITDYDYDKIEYNYEKDGQKILQQEKCLNYLAGKNTNTCAIRLSYALNGAGYKIPAKSPGVRIQRGSKGDKGNYILTAEGMYKYLSTIEKPSYSSKPITTKEEADEVINKLHEYDNIKAIVVLIAGDKAAYEATGHADLLFEDWGSDLSLYSHGAWYQFGFGDDLRPYLRKDSHLKSKLSVYVWVLNNN